jgi:hypothetical protein
MFCVAGNVSFPFGIAFFGEHKAAGVKPLLCVQDFLTVSPEPKK